MEHKQLSAQALKKLSNMDYDDKVRLYARLRILKQNSQISGILTRTLNDYYINDVKAEITHHLYDGNNNYAYGYKYYEILDAMRENINVFQHFNTYTMCAYMIYFEKFIELAKNAKDMDDLRYAKDCALSYVKQTCDFSRDRMEMDYDEKQAKISSLLKPEYRREVVEYLTKDLKIKDGFEFARQNMEEDFEFTDCGEISYSCDKVYANNVEEYTDENGNVCYLDADGNLYQSDEIEDFNYNDYTLSATENGFSVHKKDYDDEYTK